MPSDASLINAITPHESLAALMWRRFTALWRLKLLLTAVITPIFIACYLGIQKIVSTDRTFPLLWIDEFAGFSTWWVYIYVSEYIIIPVPPLLAHTRRQLRALAVGLTVTSVISFVVFLIYPVAAPRQMPADGDSNWVFDWLMGVDGVTNSFPSLHVGLTGFIALYAHRVIDRDFPRAARAALLTIIWVWTLLIWWSTMATKQHYFVDIAGGFVVAVFAHWVAWRERPGR
jgi:membrane-associated phospholipid phosphatase